MPDKRKHTILLVDDHPIVLEGLRALLAKTDDLAVIGTCLTPESALAFLLDHAPDLILMDISMKDANGLLATKRICADHPRIPILIFTCNDEKIYASMAASVGAKGLVMKDQPNGEILRAIRTVLQGQSYRSPGMDKPSEPPTSRRPDETGHAPPPDKLSKKELEILDYLVEGYSTARLALTLNVSLKTIETHRLNIRNKLGIDNQNDLVRWAICRRSKGLNREG